MPILLYNFPYFLVAIMFITGFYMIIIRNNLLAKVIGLNILQSSVIVFYIFLSYIKNSEPPIIYSNYKTKEIVYSNPLPHVLMLTAIVVGIAITSVAYAIIYKIYSKYGTIKESQLIKVIKQEEQ